MRINIRKIEQRDVPAIAEILREPGLFARIESETPAETLNHISRQLALCLNDDSHLVLVAEVVDGEILGYAAVHWLPYLMLPGPKGHVSELIVDEAWRGRGLGARLLEAVEPEARSSAGRSAPTPRASFCRSDTPACFPPSASGIRTR